jgi:mycothiol synthase
MPRIDVLPVSEDRVDLLAAYAAVHAATDQEVNPDDPPAPVDELATELFRPTPLHRRLAWVATIDGEPAGQLRVALEGAPNEHRAEVEWLAVVPGHRRRGVADALLRTALADPAVAERSSLTFWVPVLADGAGIAVAERCGASMVLAERCSRLRVADAPWDLLDDWVAQGRSRTDGYRLVQWVGPIADEHVGLLAAVRRAMEDQPTGDLDRTVPTLDDDAIREFDASAVAQGLVPVLSVAVAADGDPAGYSALFLNGHRPTLGWQGDTGVLADHRGHGLGRWLKAENLRQGLTAEPRLATIETYNAESNPWMLDINVTMGFAPHVAYQAWQADADDVRKAIGA